MIMRLFKKLAYRSCLLGLMNRLLNRRALTVIMFHRVLSTADPRWKTSDPDYTISDTLFEQCLAFFRRHYSIVTMEQVGAARQGHRPLPPNPLLITFDDGWWDTFAYALPALQRAGLPAALFMVADAVGRTQPFFQEQLVAAWRSGDLSPAQARQLFEQLDLEAPPHSTDDLRPLRKAIAALESLSDTRRSELLAALPQPRDDAPRQMVNAAELVELLHRGIAIGLHGKTHTPLTRATDLDAELAGARGQLHTLLGHASPVPDTLSFPHGKWNDSIVRRARECGYALVFTSVPALNPVRPRPSDVLGRIGFETANVTDQAGNFCPELLALYLFRRPRQALLIASR